MKKRKMTEKEFEKAKELHKKLFGDVYVEEDEIGDFAHILKMNDMKKENLKLNEYYNTFKNVFYPKGDKRLFEKYATTEICKISKDKIQRGFFCSSFLHAVTDKDFNKMKAVKTNRCHDKYCARCQKYTAIKTALVHNVLYDYIRTLEGGAGFEFIFLTLTAPNVTSEQLEAEITDLANAVDRLFKRRNVKKINLGYILKLEITYNKRRKDFHPHYHILICVPNDYFNPKKDLYIKRDEWLKMWQECKNDDRITQVDVRKLREKTEDEKRKEKQERINRKANGLKAPYKKKEEDIKGAMLELAKYISKSNDYLISEDVFADFYNATYRRRATRYGGYFREGYIKFKNGELDGLIPKDETKYVFMLQYEYEYRLESYNRTQIRELTEAEMELIAMREMENLKFTFDKEG